MRDGDGVLLRRIVLTLLLVAVWIVTHPYGGIVHDAQLYMVQALYRIDPARYAGDLYFQFGSQDRFTVFSLIYAPMVAALGIGPAHLGMALAGQAAWLGGLVALVRTLYRSEEQRWLAAFAACLLVPAYNFGTLRYGEPFATPRIFVEAMTMVALALVLRRRRWAAFAVMGLALLFHPLMALPGLGLVALVALPFVRIVLPFAVAGLFAALALAVSGVDPFTRLLVRMDAEWVAAVLPRNPMVFVSTWAWQAAAVSVLPVFSLVIVARRGNAEHRVLARWVLVLIAVLVTVSWIGGDILHNVLLLGVQQWRAMWLMLLLANCLAPAVLLLLPKAGRSRAFFIAALVANVFEARFGIWSIPVVSALLALTAALEAVVQTERGKHSRRWLGFAQSGLAALATLVTLGEVAMILSEFHLASDFGDFVQRLVIVFAVTFLMWAVVPGRGAARGWAVGAPVALVVWAGALFDVRSQTNAFITSDAPLDARFEAALAGKRVYWEGGLHIQWFRLRQPAYFAWYQAAGAVFFRETAMEHQRRAEVLRRLDTADFAGAGARPAVQRANPMMEGPQSAGQLRAACRALPDLDVMVLRAEVPSVPHLTWRPEFPVPASGFVRVPEDDIPSDPPRRPYGAFHLYSCADLRGG